MKALFIAIGATLLCTVSAAAYAGELAGVRLIRQQDGERLSIWRHQGRNWVVGTPGDRYAIEIRNKTAGRLLTVVSVDGVNVISGATAATGQQGYVLEGWQVAPVAGWRKSMDEVAAFYFTRLPDSYAARSGRPNHVGVIGVALFREYVAPQMTDDHMSDLASAPAAEESTGKRGNRAEARLGTGHGERIGSVTRHTEFQRASEAPDEIITIHYDTRERLMARGVIPRPRPQPSRSVPPQAFPGEFVPDPS